MHTDYDWEQRNFNRSAALRRARRSTVADMERVAARLADNPSFLAYDLRGYGAAALGEVLNTDALGVARLRLCRGPVTFAGCREIAEYVGCDAFALAALLDILPF